MAGTHRSRPPRPIRQCPVWCATDHTDGDQGHGSDAVYVPTIVARHHDGRPEPTELLVATTRNEDGEDWTYIGPPDTVSAGLFLTPESAARLSRAVASHVNGLTGAAEPAESATDESVD